jgi:hypothetical protein
MGLRIERRKRMRTILGVSLLGATALMLLGGCSSEEGSELCQGITVASVDRFRFSALPNTETTVITTPPARKDCTTELELRIRYEDESLADRQAPDNIDVEFGVDGVGGSGSPTIIDEGTPEHTTRYRRKYIEWNTHTNAAGREEESVEYYIRVGTDSAGDQPVLIEAAIRYSAYGASPPPGIVY